MFLANRKGYLISKTAVLGEIWACRTVK